MLVNSNRKCTGYGNPTTTFPDHRLDSFTTSVRSQILAAYGAWVVDWIQQGWDGYLVTVMFHNLPGSMNSQITQMHQEVTTLFSKLTTRMVRKPRSPTWAPLLPKGLFVPDLPVFKWTKTPILDVSTNNGLHMHGIILANRWGRLTDPLDRHFRDKRATYVAGKIRSIDVVKIKDRPQYTTRPFNSEVQRADFWR